VETAAAYLLNFQSISRNDLSRLVSQTSIYSSLTEQMRNTFLGFIDRVISFNNQADLNPTVSARNIFQALELMKSDDKALQFSLLIDGLNLTHSELFPRVLSDNQIYDLVRAQCLTLAKKANIPESILPEIRIFSTEPSDPSKKSDEISKGTYNTYNNVLSINAAVCQSLAEIESTVAHEFKHFQDFLEMKKLAIQHYDLFERTIYEVADDHAKAQDLALVNYQYPISANDLFFVVGVIFQTGYDRLNQSPLLAIVKATIAILQDQKLDLNTPVNSDEFLKINKEKIEIQLNLDREVSSTVPLVIEAFNRASTRDKYAYLTKLDDHQTLKAMSLLKGVIQVYYSIAKKLPYNNNLPYYNSEEETLARISQNSFSFKKLLETNPELKQKVSNRPNQGKSIDLQPQEWVEDLCKSVMGERLVQLATKIKADSIFLRLSRTMRKERGLAGENIISLINFLKNIDQNPVGNPFQEYLTSSDQESLLNNSNLSDLLEGIQSEQFSELEKELSRIKDFASKNGFSLHARIFDSRKLFRTIGTTAPLAPVPQLQFIVRKALYSLESSGIDVQQINKSISEADYLAAFVAAWNLGQKEEQMLTYLNEYIETLQKLAKYRSIFLNSQAFSH
jgi:hypothetical protein